MITQQAEPKNDVQFAEKAARRKMDEDKMNEILSVTRAAFTALYGEEPHSEDPVWVWYVTEVFQTNMRLSVTIKTEEKKAL